MELHRVQIRRYVVGTFSGIDRGVSFRVIGGETIHWSLRNLQANDVLQELSRTIGKPIE